MARNTIVWTVIVGAPLICAIFGLWSAYVGTEPVASSSAAAIGAFSVLVAGRKRA